MPAPVGFSRSTGAWCIGSGSRLVNALCFARTPVVGSRGADVNRPQDPIQEGSMTRLRMAALTAMTVCAVSLGAAGTASAQGEPAATPLTKTVALKGTKGFKGTYTIDR